MHGKLVSILATLVLLAVCTGPKARAQTWEPPMPVPDSWDWIQMTSGEWLKGEIRSLRDTSIEFASDEFDVQIGLPDPKQSFHHVNAVLGIGIEL